MADVAPMLIRFRFTALPVATPREDGNAELLDLACPYRRSGEACGCTTGGGHNRRHPHGSAHHEADVRRLHGTGNDPGLGRDVVRPEVLQRDQLEARPRAFGRVWPARTAAALDADRRR